MLQARRMHGRVAVTSSGRELSECNDNRNCESLPKDGKFVGWFVHCCRASVLYNPMLCIQLIFLFPDLYIMLLFHSPAILSS